MSLGWRAAAFLLVLAGCSSKWQPPHVEPVAVSDNDQRVCAPENRCTDVILAVDTSGSAADAPGAAPELTFGALVQLLFAGPPEAGSGSRLWVGVDGIASALERLDPARVSVALTGFAGHVDTSTTDSARGETWLEVGFSDDYDAIHTALEHMRARGVSGSSCHACAIEFAGSLFNRYRDLRHCQVLVLVGDVDPTQPFGPENMSANQREVIRAVAATQIANFTIVSLGQGDDEQLTRMRGLLEPKWGTIQVATDSAGVADAIVKAVDSCD